MSEAELLGDVEVVADGEDARSSGNPAFSYDHGAVVQGTVFEEDVLYEPLRYLGIDLFACSHELGQREVVLQHDEGADVLLAHVHAGHDDGEDGVALVAELAGVLVLVEPEEAQEAVGLLSGTEVVEEAPNVLLEKDDDGQRSDAHQLVEDAAKQLHLKHFADDNPSAHEEEDTIEDVDGARLLHQLVAIVEHYCHKENVHYVFEADVRQGFNSLTF